MFLFSRQLDTQCAIFGTNGTPAYSRSASRTRWNYRSFACSVTGNDRQPYTYLQVDIPLLFVLPSKLGPEVRVDNICMYISCKNVDYIIIMMNHNEWRHQREMANFLSQEYVRICTVSIRVITSCLVFDAYICMYVCVYNMHRELDKSCVSIYTYIIWILFLPAPITVLSFREHI